MNNEDLMALLRCPICAQQDKGEVERYRDYWFICRDCGRKYPMLINGILHLMPQVGDQWENTAKEDLPVPPPEPN